MAELTFRNRDEFGFNDEGCIYGLIKLHEDYLKRILNYSDFFKILLENFARKRSYAKFSKRKTF
ncbi:hypothetical protein J4462_03315 [Candidatus Pacearchaeota archaeon]|nr:hypothetical protein [Candidatus Pacearchaeota archaeon]